MYVGDNFRDDLPVISRIQATVKCRYKGYAIFRAIITCDKNDLHNKATINLARGHI